VFLGVVAGWILTATHPIKEQPSIAWLVTSFVSVVAGATLWSLYKNQRSYRKVAQVVRGIGSELGLYEGIYPKDWSRFGTESVWMPLLPHWATVLGTGIFCISVVWIR